MTRSSAIATILALACATVACGGAAPPPAVSPADVPAAPPGAPEATAPASAEPRSAAADPFALPEGPRDDAPVAPDPGALPLGPWQRAAKMNVGAAPAACAAFVGRRAAKPAPKDLATALGERDAAKRDALLVAREPDEPPGLVRALRAELAPVECADAIVDPFLAKQTTASGPYGHLLVGLSLAGKLARTAAKPPAFAPSSDKEKVKAFIHGPLAAWMKEQANAIQALSASAVGLTGYGRGLAALEAGLADLRLVDRIRSAPVPASWDAELKSVYEAALDEALEPRKARGRDAALVGLSDLAEAGVLPDARVARARAMLAKLYGGRRIDALDGLLLPPRPALTPSTPGEAAALAVPTFWLDAAPAAVAPGVDVAKTPVALGRGLPRGARAAVAAADGIQRERASAHARARLELGRAYWRRIDFVEAAHAAAKAGAGDEDRLVLAVALALARGPNGAAAMMNAAAPSALGLAHTEALDALVAEGGPLAGMAAYDAAHLRAVAPPDGREAAPYLRDVAARFTKASELLSDAGQKKLALERAREAEAAARAAEAR